MAQKPSIPKGTRDFSPLEVCKRSYIFDTIKQCFKLYGFQPIETPSFEKSSTLMGKYGDEGDRLIFKILNSGDFLAKADAEALENKNSQKVTSSISEKALRYDLTVPFARYVVQHQNDITFPFKRYQIQPVWRADRPQKGRFREFYQCDADIVGSTSLLQEVELIKLYDDVFTKLQVPGVTIKLNNRKILSGIAEVIGEKDKLIDFTVALDKLDKIGKEGVVNEMLSKGISQNAIDKIDALFNAPPTIIERLEVLTKLLQSSTEGMEGVKEIKQVLEALVKVPLKSAQLDIDVTLARGLNYYTGAIFEVAPPKGISMGSIGGGGRYDNLTGVFGLNNMSGIGISFGLDRIYLVMEELGVFPEAVLDSTKVLFINFGTAESLYALSAIEELRENGIASELYPDSVKMKKQMTYANKRGIPFVVLAGESEMNSKKLVLKNMKSGEQKELALSDLISTLS